jgi:hydroxymethylbilane synthase
MRLRIGTRASALARWQAEWVAAAVARGGAEVELIPVATRGDQQQAPIGRIGGSGVFTKEIQRALLDQRIDLAVHSLKDLPTEETPGLTLAAVPARAAVHDVLVSREGLPLERLPAGALVGTGSQRRRSQLLHARPDLRTQDIRGNVETRLRKLRDGQFDVVILAEAGLQRLGLSAQITQVLPMAIFLPAIGQGALGIEARTGDEPTRAALAPLNDAATCAAVTAERAMLAALQGGCLAPVAGWGRVEADRLVLSGRVLSPDGSHMLDATLSADPADAASLGQRVAQQLLDQGAADLIRASRATG